MKAVQKGLIALAVLVTLGGTALLQAWPVMVGAGILHGHWPTVPDFTYWESFWLTWAWAVVWVSMGRNVNTEVK